MRAAMILAFGIRLAMAPAAGAETLTLPDYSGVWKLNRGLSHDPAQALEDMRGSSGGSSGWNGRGGHGRHGGSGGSGDAFAALETLTIRHSEPQVTIVDGVGREHRSPPTAGNRRRSVRAAARRR